MRNVACVISQFSFIIFVFECLILLMAYLSKFSRTSLVRESIQHYCTDFIIPQIFRESKLTVQLININYNFIFYSNVFSIIFLRFSTWSIVIQILRNSLSSTGRYDSNHSSISLLLFWSILCTFDVSGLLVYSCSIYFCVVLVFSNSLSPSFLNSALTPFSSICISYISPDPTLLVMFGKLLVPDLIGLPNNFVFFINWLIQVSSQDFQGLVTL